MLKKVSRHYSCFLPWLMKFVAVRPHKRTDETQVLFDLMRLNVTYRLNLQLKAQPPIVYRVHGRFYP